MEGLIVCLIPILVIKICSTIKLEKHIKDIKYTLKHLKNKEYKNELNKLFAEFSKEKK